MRLDIFNIVYGNINELLYFIYTFLYTPSCKNNSSLISGV